MKKQKKGRQYKSVTNLYIIETPKGIYKNDKGKAIIFETQFDALNFIEKHDLKEALVLMCEEEDL